MGYAPFGGEYSISEIFHRGTGSNNHSGSINLNIQDDVMKKMKVDKLKAELSKRGINRGRLKKDLVDKLMRAMVENSDCK